MCVDNLYLIVADTVFIYYLLDQNIYYLFQHCRELFYSGVGQRVTFRREVVVFKAILPPDHESDEFLGVTNHFFQNGGEKNMVIEIFVYPCNE